MANHVSTLTLKGWTFLLFKRKKCKICGSRLEKRTIKKDLGVQRVNAGGVVYEDRTFECRIEYHCKHCGEVLTVITISKIIIYLYSIQENKSLF